MHVPVSEPSGDRSEAGHEQARTASLVARRSPLTGRVTYVDSSGARELRRRVPRPILASASLMAVAIGMAVATIGSPPPQAVEPSPVTIQSPSALTLAPSVN